ncbi:MAG: hypothetical protein OEW59_04180, partial [Gammaproteobacteria bacterium]|nr:hypothetical protein [Gammaproteobacteria bacterium]
MTGPKNIKLSLVAATTSLIVCSTFAMAQESPAEWLERMAVAVGSTNYQGTVIRRKRGESEALKVV